MKAQQGRHIPENERPSHLPRPVILDANLRLKPDCKLLKNYREGKGRRPWVICDANLTSDDGRKSTLEDAGARVIGVPSVDGGSYSLLSWAGHMNVFRFYHHFGPLEGSL
jgi:riboflavin biosynthesis pyrimidine reductase